MPPGFCSGFRSASVPNELLRVARSSPLWRQGALPVRSFLALSAAWPLPFYMCFLHAIFGFSVCFLAPFLRPSKIRLGIRVPFLRNPSYRPPPPFYMCFLRAIFGFSVSFLVPFLRPSKIRLGFRVPFLRNPSYRPPPPFYMCFLRAIFVSGGGFPACFRARFLRPS